LICKNDGVKNFAYSTQPSTRKTLMERPKNESDPIILLALEEAEANVSLS
jgi:hypothetical protein